MAVYLNFPAKKPCPAAEIKVVTVPPSFSKVNFASTKAKIPNEGTRHLV